MCPGIRRHGGAVLHRPANLDYLRLTDRSPDQVRLVKPTPKTAGLWADTLRGVCTSTLTLTLAAWCATWPAPSTRTGACPPPAWPARHCRRREMPMAPTRAGRPDARWRRDHCRHHQLHQHQQPAQRDCRALLARNAHRRGWCAKPWVKTSLAPGSKAVELYLKEAGLTDLEALGFGIVAFACTTCNGMSGALDPAIQQRKSSTATCTPRRCSRATATLMGASTLCQAGVSWPRRRWWWPTRWRARCGLTSKRMCWPLVDGRLSA